MKKVIVFIFSLLILSCQKDDSEIEFSLPIPDGLTHWDILKVGGENSVNVNDTLVLDVYCPRSSSCDYISQLLSDDYGNKILIEAFGHTNTESPCLMFALPQVLEYEFIPNKKGFYSLEFIKRDETKIIFTVDVK
ncbi:hypothetical protein [Mangrovibacterium lignilyticum]|uniref:hypothetical protein n=1 Tax=Mangrovibacterium lignilyticum TaxID=2668052 RepID=UPI0013D800C2|nr:hypothetical protein [Mangrovibacterium lignilyticum]